MKTKLKKTVLCHPKAKYTSGGVKIRWSELDPNYRRQFARLLAEGQCVAVMEKGKKYVVMQ